MDIKFQTGSLSWRTEAVIVPLFEGEKWEMSSLAQAVPWLQNAPGSGDFRGKTGEIFPVYGPSVFPIPRVFAVGLGDAGDWRPEVLRHGLGKAVRLCREYGLSNLGVDFSSLCRIAERVGAVPSELAREVVLSVLLGLYRYDQWLTDKKDWRADPTVLNFLVEEADMVPALLDAVRLGEAEAVGLNLARDLGNSPANEMTPVAFAEAAQKMADRHAMRCRVLNPTQMRDEKMGALLAVAGGAGQEPRFVIWNIHRRVPKEKNQ